MNDNSDTNSPHANGFISAILGFLMLIFVSVFVVLLTVRTIDPVEAIQNVDVTRLLEDAGMSYMAVDVVNRLPFVENYVDLSDIDKFMRNETVSHEIGRVMDGYLAAFAEGDLDHHITQDEVLNIVRNLSPELSYLFGHEMSSADYDLITEILDEAVDLSGFSVGNMLSDINIDAEIPQFFMSGNLLIVVGVLCLLTVFLMILHHRKRFSDVFKNAGFPILLSGIICFMLGFIATSFTQVLDVILYGMSALLQDPLSLFMTYSLYTAALGLALVIIFIICRATRPLEPPPRQNHRRFVGKNGDRILR